MSHDQTTIEGEVTEIFAHRFAVKTATGTILADLGPKGAEEVRLERGDHVELNGELKPSELKVHRITKGGGPAIAIDHHKKPHDEQEAEDPTLALKAAAANGFSVLGQPRRKPKHFEILGRDSGGDLVELHVEIDGTLRKTRPVAAADPKWSAEIGTKS